MRLVDEIKVNYDELQVIVVADPLQTVEEFDALLGVTIPVTLPHLRQIVTTRTVRTTKKDDKRS